MIDSLKDFRAAFAKLDSTVLSPEQQKKLVGYYTDVFMPKLKKNIMSLPADSFGMKTPLIEVHLSNPLSREEFRHTSVISGVANGTIGGFGPNSYVLAIIAMQNLLAK